MIRKLAAPDYEKIFSWIEELSSAQFNWTPESLRAEFLSGPVYGFVEADQVLAFVCVRESEDHDEFTVLATCLEAQGRGLMWELLVNTLGQIRTGKQVWLEVHESNQSARYLYEKLGFKATGKRPQYYSDGGSAILYTWERRI